MWQDTEEDKQADYEAYKCKHLRGTAVYSELMALEIGHFLELTRRNQI